MTTAGGPGRRLRSQAAQADADAARQATLEAMHARLVEQVTSLQSLEEWQRWLAFAGSFHQYSFLNTVLIYSQRPDATAVAGYRTWQAHGRQVRRGEHAIRVYGPVTRRVPLTDPTGAPLLDEHGKPRHTTAVIGVKPVSVFDVAQTDGDPLPTQPQAQLLAGQAPDGLWDALARIVERQGYSVHRRPCGAANGITRLDTNQVWVRPDVDDAQAVKTLAHETAHVLAHTGDGLSLACRGIIEVEAESVAYLVTHAHGLDSSQYTFNYVAGWAHTTPGSNQGIDEVITATGKRVIATADRILTSTQPAPTLVDQAISDLERTVRPRAHQVAAHRLGHDDPAERALLGRDRDPRPTVATRWPTTSLH